MNVERKIEKAFSVTYMFLFVAIAFKSITKWNNVFGEIASYLHAIAEIIIYLIIIVAIINEVILLIKGLLDENKYWRIASLIRFGFDVDSIRYYCFYRIQ